MEQLATPMYTDMMLFVEAHNMTAGELSELRERHDIGVQPGYVTKLTARKVENRIVWSITRIKEGYHKTLGVREERVDEKPIEEELSIAA